MSVLNFLGSSSSRGQKSAGGLARCSFQIVSNLLGPFFSRARSGKLARCSLQIVSNLLSPLLSRAKVRRGDVRFKLFQTFSAPPSLAGKSQEGSWEMFVPNFFKLSQPSLFLGGASGGGGGWDTCSKFFLKPSQLLPFSPVKVGGGELKMFITIVSKFSATFSRAKVGRGS